MFAQIAAVGAAIATGGTGAGVVAGAGLLTSSISSGNATDQARQTRVSWTLDMAKRGQSPTAAAIIIAAPNNVGGNEKPMWDAARPQVPTNVLANAIAMYGTGGYWPVGQPDFYTDTNGATHQRIVAEANAAFQSTPAPVPNVPAPTITQGTIAEQVHGLAESVNSSFFAPAPTQQSAQSLPTMVTTANAPSSSSSMMMIALAVLAIVALLFILKR